MIFSKSVLAATFALTASALPQPNPTSTATSSAASTSSSSTSSPNSGVNVINNLNTTVYLWSASSATSNSDVQSLSARGGTYYETFQTNTDGSGISIKMSTTKDQASVLQFEYTDDGETLFWDLSSIDLHTDSAFVTAGFSATPDDESCESASCAAGDADCANAYQVSDDDDTLSCSSGAGFTLTLG